MHDNFFSTGILGPDIFLNLVFILRDDAIGSLHNVVSRTVILFQFKQLRIRIVLLEIEYVSNVSPAKSIDTLGVIPHNTNVLELRR
ncbi:MAG: Uncharacterised protein [Cryomorphaceae bacterium]|nr:MAG: Uncharacterised protein [Cryomorphaceae bacterium]